MKKNDIWMLVVSLVLCISALVLKYALTLPSWAFMLLGLSGVALFVLYDVRDNRRKRFTTPEEPEKPEDKQENKQENKPEE